MKFTATIVATGLLATASAFSPSSAGFTTQTYNVGERAVGPMQQGTAHSQRRATIVMDGKANGASSFVFFESIYVYSIERVRAKRDAFGQRRGWSIQRSAAGIPWCRKNRPYVGISTISTRGRIFGAFP